MAIFTLTIDSSASVDTSPLLPGNKQMVHIFSCWFATSVETAGYAS
jgi:hypothetical protein